MSLRTNIHWHRRRTGHLAHRDVYGICSVCWTSLVLFVGLVLVGRRTYGIDVGLVVFVQYLCYIRDICAIFVILCYICDIYAIFVLYL